MKSIVTFGELMLKLATSENERFVQATTFKVEYSGAEANVAVSLANFGCNAVFVTRIPNNPIGDAALNTMRKFGVDTSAIKQVNERIGIYFSEKGASQRSSQVIYDRKNSAFSNSKNSDYKWNEILNNVQWFHVSGITPALSDSLSSICVQALKIAKSKGIITSCDLNYRSKLWGHEKASETMQQICQYVDVCMANETDSYDVFGIKAPIEIKDNNKKYEWIAEVLQNKFSFKIVAITQRESITANDNRWSATLFDGKTFYHSKKYDIHIVDRIGSGDAFAAGLIYSLINNFDCQYAIDFAVAASCLKHSIEGDFNLVSVAEVENVVVGNGSGRIVR